MSETPTFTTNVVAEALDEALKEVLMELGTDAKKLGTEVLGDLKVISQDMALVLTEKPELKTTLLNQTRLVLEKKRRGLSKKARESLQAFVSATLSWGTRILTR